MGAWNHHYLIYFMHIRTHRQLRRFSIPPPLAQCLLLQEKLPPDENVSCDLLRFAGTGRWVCQWWRNEHSSEGHSEVGDWFPLTRCYLGRLWECARDHQLWWTEGDHIVSWHLAPRWPLWWRGLILLALPLGPIRMWLLHTGRRCLIGSIWRIFLEDFFLTFPRMRFHMDASDIEQAQTKDSAQ